MVAHATDTIGTAAATELVIVRQLDAPREAVWKAWTEPERVMRWWGPKNFATPFCTIDLRVGGTFLSCMRSPEGQDYWSTGTYREIVEPSLLVCTDSFADEQGTIVPAAQYGLTGEWPDELLVEVTLEERDGGTLMTLRHFGHPAGEMKEQCEAGWNESFDKLADLLAQGRGGQG
ncbi:SRPBCC domain-containing protein [Geobacter sp. SVR]|uniref:SRPBCC family protein n=1 Tax=Geobacter sp. SVR TaxID=2495594 RepID=UPI00143EF71F|nr:SRPBCC domain-containing protein [Geobacter sp. SVR]BCS52545.1 ATPase [Geobacter sp. SVR]GCF84017.1 ATPase [Geobacter sp. SVR]